MRLFRLLAVLALAGLVTLPNTTLAHGNAHHPGTGPHDGDHYVA